MILHRAGSMITGMHLAQCLLASALPTADFEGQLWIRGSETLFTAPAGLLARRTVLDSGGGLRGPGIMVPDNAVYVSDSRCPSSSTNAPSPFLPNHNTWPVYLVACAWQCASPTGTVILRTCFYWDMVCSF
jgi:hypothetical protein